MHEDQNRTPGGPPPEDAQVQGDAGSPGAQDEVATAAGGGPPDDTGATRVLSGEPDQPTQVMPPEEPTTVMPPPPPPASTPPSLRQPTVTMTRRPSSNRTVWWIVIVLLIVAAVAVAMFLFLAPDESGSAGQDFVGTWMPADAGGGGLIIKQNGDTFTVDAYDGQIQQVGSSEATLNGDELELTMPGSAIGEPQGGELDVTISYISGQDSLHLVAQGGGATRVDRDYVRTDVLQPVQAPVTPTVAPTPTPTPSPTPTTSGSPSATADQIIMAGLVKIQSGVAAWATNSNAVYPAASEVSSTGGIAQYVNPWPVNPYTNQPMQAGTSPGDYQYEQLDGGAAYKLTGYLGNNLTYVLP